MTWLDRHPVVGELMRNRLCQVGGGLLAALLSLSLLAPWVAPYDPLAIDFSVKLQPPSAEHWFGTDALGRDLFSQVLYGGRLTLLMGASALAVALLIGMPVGLLAGFLGGRIDAFLMRFADVFLAFPPLLLPIAITAALGPGLFNAMLAIAVSWFPWYARILRSSVLAVRSQSYVDAARVSGMGNGRIMFRHVLPNSMTAVLVQASMDLGYMILAAASLSFIGLGARPPQLEWGLMIAGSRSVFLEFWWTAAFPGLAIFLAVMAINLLGDGLRDVFDPDYEGRP